MGVITLIMTEEKWVYKGNGEANHLSITLQNMEYIDFTAQRLHLHNNCKRAIVDLMKDAEVEEIDLLHKENVFGAAWLIRYFYGDTTMEEVQVTKIKLDGEALLYKGRNTVEEVDEDWQKLEISDNVISATIDSVYEAVWLRLKK